MTLTREPNHQLRERGYREGIHLGVVLLLPCRDLHDRVMHGGLRALAGGFVDFDLFYVVSASWSVALVVGHG